MNLKYLILFFIILEISISRVYSSIPSKVSYQEILLAMQTQSGYDYTKSTNVARFQANVLFQIAYNSLEKDTNRTILLIGHLEWFNAYKKFIGLSNSELPSYAHLAKDFKQDQLLDFRQGKVYEKIVQGRKPILAMNVVLGWSLSTGLPSRYFYIDTLSTPNLKVTNSNKITYRLLDFGNMILYDDIVGLTGQPTTGFLGLLFKFIGEGQVVQSKSTISHDNIFISRAKAKKGPFQIESTLTILPNGNAQKGLPKNRKYLKSSEKFLQQPLKINYIPFEPEIIAIICGEE